ncbi:MAG TPA: MgtC/SapB family protein [Micropepsaceae bacterium]|nr:MgtC/SapB family protein [Micropepsaceae bacterium]
MNTIDLFQRLGLALAIGLLIGLERGWREREEREGSRTAGIRTFALIGLLGGVWGATLPILGPIPLAIAGLAFAAAFTLFQWREGIARNDFSVTSTIAGFVVFALGAFAVLGDRTAAAGAGVATLVLLAARTNLHEFLKRLSWPELRSAIVLLAMTFLLLPILPDRPIDPWNALNPYELWLMIVLIGVVSFAGYIAVRTLGERRGLAISAAAGAMISSTAVTLGNSRLAAKSAGSNAMVAIAICLAWIVSLARMTIIAIAIDPQLLRSLAIPMGAAIAVLAFAVLLFCRRMGNDPARFDTTLFQNPLDLRFVLGFGSLLAGVFAATKLLSAAFGQAGVLTLAGISGFVDVDPITLSSARLSGTAIAVDAAAQAILLAGAANMVTKMAITVLVGGIGFGWKLVLAGALAIASGALVFVGIS